MRRRRKERDADLLSMDCSNGMASPLRVAGQAAFASTPMRISDDFSYQQSSTSSSLPLPANQIDYQLSMRSLPDNEAKSPKAAAVAADGDETAAGLRGASILSLGEASMPMPLPLHESPPANPLE